MLFLLKKYMIYAHPAELLTGKIYLVPIGRICRVTASSGRYGQGVNQKFTLACARSA